MCHRPNRSRLHIGDHGPAVIMKLAGSARTTHPLPPGEGSPVCREHHPVLARSDALPRPHELFVRDGFTPLTHAQVPLEAPTRVDERPHGFGRA